MQPGVGFYLGPDLVFFSVLEAAFARYRPFAAVLLTFPSHQQHYSLYA